MSDATVDALERLARLRDDGHLTEAEFEQEKARILAAPEADPEPPAPTPAPLRKGPGPGAIAALVLAGLLFVAAVTLAAWPGLLRKPAPAPAEVAAVEPATPASPAQQPPAPLALLDARKLAFPNGLRLADEESGDALTYKPVRLVTLAPGRMALLSVGALEDGCHACTGAFAVHYLAWNGTAWRVVGDWPVLVRTGTFGQIAGWSVRLDLFTGPALLVEGGGMWQGCTVGSVDILELTPEKPILRAENVLNVFDYPRPEERSEAEAQALDIDYGATQLKIRPMTKDRAFQAVYDGDYARTVTWTAKGATYKAGAGAEELPGC